MHPKGNPQCQLSYVELLRCSDIASHILAAYQFRSYVLLYGLRDLLADKSCEEITNFT